MKLLNKSLLEIRARGLSVYIRLIIANVFHKPLYSLLSFKLFLSFRAFILLGYWPCLKNPVTFNEKILHRKIYKIDDRATLIADKWKVRQYVEACGLKEILNEIYCVTNDPETINYNLLPDSFVIKVNYGSNRIFIVKDKHRININAINSQCNKWISAQEKSLKYATEIHYRGIKPLIIIEKYLDSEGPLNDYKLWCFNGKVICINVQSAVKGIRVTAMYNREWTRLPFTTANKPAAMNTIKKPSCLDNMIQTAEILSAGFSFIRVDLYCLNKNKIIFGELTYNPGGGMAIFIPRKWDKTLGIMLKIQ